MKWKLAVLDLAGTTVEDNDAVAHCLDDALRLRGFEVEFQQIVSLMGIPKPEAVRQLAVGASEKEQVEIHLDFQERMIRHYRESPEVREIPGTSETFRWLRSQGILVGIDTGFDRATVDILLRRLPWEALIDASIASDEVENGRPFPDMIFRLTERLAVADLASVIKVGDTPSDLRQGTSAGCGMVVGVCQGSHTKDQMAAHPHTHLIESVADLPGLLAD
ncbi:MAG: HAD hydrolase-like protein [Chlorobia bacterium]|nr:HAD hydrolase-like protein [Fimbriimonadaceae bacterium]